ncbi:MAG: lytic transglycosylase domain-containing protein [Bacteroidales bacterium]
MAELLFSVLVKENKTEFLEKVKKIASNLCINPDWLMAVMKKESGMRATATNFITGATGLIQFMPRTAVGLGTTCAELKAMSNVYQLNFVEKYYKPYAGRINSFVDLYLVTFFPAALGKQDDWIMQTPYLPASLVAQQNSGVDLNKDRQITVGEFKTYCYKGFTSVQVDILKKKVRV